MKVTFTIFALLFLCFACKTVGNKSFDGSAVKTIGSKAIPETTVAVCDGGNIKIVENHEYSHPVFHLVDPSDKLANLFMTEMQRKTISFQLASKNPFVLKRNGDFCNTGPQPDSARLFTLERAGNRLTLRVFEAHEPLDHGAPTSDCVADRLSDKAVFDDCVWSD